MKYALAFLAGSACGLYVWAYIVERLFPVTYTPPTRSPLPQRSYAPLTWTSADDRSTWTAHI